MKDSESKHAKVTDDVDCLDSCSLRRRQVYLQGEEGRPVQKVRVQEVWWEVGQRKYDPL